MINLKKEYRANGRVYSRLAQLWDAYCREYAHEVSGDPAENGNWSGFSWQYAAAGEELAEIENRRGIRALIIYLEASAEKERLQ